MITRHIVLALALLSGCSAAQRETVVYRLSRIQPTEARQREPLEIKSIQQDSLAPATVCRETLNGSYVCR